LELWKADLKNTNEKMADALADPVKYPNLFADYEWALKVEKMFLQARNNFVPAAAYSSAKADLDLNLIELLKSQPASGSAAVNHHSDSNGKEIEEKMEGMTIQNNEKHNTSGSPVDGGVVPSSSGAVSPKHQNAAESPAKPVPVVSASLPSSPPPSSGDNGERDLDEVLDEEDRLLNQSSSSPSKALPPSPPGSLENSPVSPLKPSAAVVEQEEEEEEDEGDVDLDYLGDDVEGEEDVPQEDEEEEQEGKDILENDDNEGFESGEDW
jgi:hypothetical protein